MKKSNILRYAVTFGNNFHLRGEVTMVRPPFWIRATSPFTDLTPQPHILRLLTLPPIHARTGRM